MSTGSSRGQATQGVLGQSKLSLHMLLSVTDNKERILVHVSRLQQRIYQISERLSEEVWQKGIREHNCTVSMVSKTPF